jgi:integrase
MSEKIVLTDRALKAIKPAPIGKRIVTWDAVQPHLGIRVTETGAKSFIVAKRLTGVRAPVVQVLGSYPAVALADARKRARTVLEQISEGIDPRKQEDAKKEENRRRDKGTFAAVARVFVAKHASKNRTAAETARIIDLYLTPTFGDQQIASIKRRQIAELLDDIEERKFVDKAGRKLGGPVMADHVLAALRKLMNWHAARDDDFVSPIVKGMARTKPKARARTRVLTDDEIRAFWIATGSRNNVAQQDNRSADNLFSALVRILLLTAQRRQEVAQMARSEIGADYNWTVPAERNKNGVPKIVPLTKDVLRIVDGLERRNDSELVFTTNGETSFSGFTKAKLRLDTDMLESLREIATKRNDRSTVAKLDDIKKWLSAPPKEAKAARQNLKREWWTLHDLRRTAKTLMARARVRPDISERVLGHVIGGVEGVYDRYEYLAEKRDALAELAKLVREIATTGLSDSLGA